MVGKKTVGTSSTEIVARKTERSLLIVCNDSSSAVYLAFDEDAVNAKGVRLAGGDRLVLNENNELSPLLSCKVNGIVASGTENVSFEDR